MVKLGKGNLLMVGILSNFHKASTVRLVLGNDWCGEASTGDCAGAVVGVALVVVDPAFDDAAEGGADEG